MLKWAKNAGADIHEYELPSQFRCKGSDGYLAFIDNALQIRETANIDLNNMDYDFRVMDDPNQLFDLIIKK
ncbi:MAG: DNA/RNA helicase domain-containing protein [Candidatus Marinimicrobia bacterium]|nr:DNA/RNA helicase domain-containing protein [Candidatus Neomarinimicrobiota bacterium]